MPRLDDSVVGKLRCCSSRHKGQENRRKTFLILKANGYFRQTDGSISATQDLTDTNLPLIYVRSLSESPHVLALEFS